MEKTCPLAGCPIQLAKGEFMCCDHWKRLSSTLRQRVAGRFKIAERDSHPYKRELFENALNEAVRFVQAKGEPYRTVDPLQAPFESRFEAELASYGVGLTPSQLERYRQYFKKHPDGGTITA
ncbi:hypothetical protein EON80_16860 [bacterium]|nr:MAG: hypothetical protein EON80_16860 [bacterium]